MRIIYENTSYINELYKIPLRSILYNVRGYLRRSASFRSAELRITADIQNFFPQTLRDLLQETSDYPRTLDERSAQLFFMTKESSTIEAITNFLFLESKTTRKVDLIFVFGSSYLITMDEVKRLYDKKVSDKVLITGHSKSKLKEIEADRFYRRGVELGLPKKIFLLERDATNTKENIINAIPIIEKAIGFKNIKKIMFVCKAFHTRRVLMTAKKFLPTNIKYYFSPVIDERNIKKENWWKDEIAKTRVLEELRRIGEYTLKGDLWLE